MEIHSPGPASCRCGGDFIGQEQGWCYSSILSQRDWLLPDLTLDGAISSRAQQVLLACSFARRDLQGSRQARAVVRQADAGGGAYKEQQLYMSR